MLSQPPYLPCPLLHVPARAGDEDPDAPKGPLLRDLGSTAQATAFMRAFFGDKRMMIVEADDVKGIKALVYVSDSGLHHAALHCILLHPHLSFRPTPHTTIGRPRSSSGNHRKTSPGGL